MFRASIFALLATAMSITAEGVNITVNATVDSHVGAVTLKAKQSAGGNQTLGPVSSGGSQTWNIWEVGTAYTVTVANVSAGYTAYWSVTKSGQSDLTGGTNSTIIIPSTSYSECTLSFYGTANDYAVTLDQQSGSGGTSSVTATYDSAMPSITVPTRTGYTFGGYYTAVNGGGTQYYAADGTSARTWNVAFATTLYAKWTANEYTLKIVPNGGSYNGSTSDYTAKRSWSRGRCATIP